jgi:WD40 repeat protein
VSARIRFALLTALVLACPARAAAPPSAGEKELQLRGAGGPVAFSPDGKLIITAAKDARTNAGIRAVHIWDAHTGKCLHTIEAGHKVDLKWHQRGFIDAVAVSPDGKTLLTGSDDGRILTYDVRTKKAVEELKGFPGPIGTLRFSPDGKKLVVKATNIHVLDWATKKEISSISLRGIDAGPSGPTSGFNAKGELLILGHPTNRHGVPVRYARFDPTTRQPVFTSREYPKGVGGVVALSPDGKLAASSGSDRTILVWDVSKGDLIASIPHTDGCNGMAFSPDGKHLAVCFKHEHFDGSTLSPFRGNVRLFEAKSGRAVKEWSGEPYPSSRLVFSPDGKYLAAGCFKPVIRIHEVKSLPAPALQKSGGTDK